MFFAVETVYLLEISVDLPLTANPSVASKRLPKLSEILFRFRIKSSETCKTSLMYKIQTDKKIGFSKYRAVLYSVWALS